MLRLKPKIWKMEISFIQSGMKKKYERFKTFNVSTLSVQKCNSGIGAYLRNFQKRERPKLEIIIQNQSQAIRVVC
jgi:hypothetical protein